MASSGPKKVRSSPGSGKIPSAVNWDSYATTMRTAFTPKTAQVPSLARKKCMRSSRYTYSPSDPIYNQTLYNDEYVWKPYSKEASYRPIMSRGAIYYNIQPSKNFFIWTPPIKELKENYNPWKDDPSAEKVKKAVKNLFTSINKKDFISREQAHKIKENYQTSEEETLFPQHADTEFRQNYKTPVRVPELRDFTFNYGYCSKFPAAQGIVPAVLLSQVSEQQRKKYQSIYRSDYGKSA